MTPKRPRRDPHPEDWDPEAPRWRDVGKKYGAGHTPRGMTREQRIHGPPGYYAEEECCSHCCRPLTLQGGGGTPHGAGVYCRECIRRHVITTGSTANGEPGEWYYNESCPYCRSAGIMEGFIFYE